MDKPANFIWEPFSTKLRRIAVQSGNISSAHRGGSKIDDNAQPSCHEMPDTKRSQTLLSSTSRATTFQPPASQTEQSACKNLTPSPSAVIPSSISIHCVANRTSSSQIAFPHAIPTCSLTPMDNRIELAQHQIPLSLHQPIANAHPVGFMTPLCPCQPHPCQEQISSKSRQKENSPALSPLLASTPINGWPTLGLDLENISPIVHSIKKARNARESNPLLEVLPRVIQPEAGCSNGNVQDRQDHGEEPLFKTPSIPNSQIQIHKRLIPTPSILFQTLQPSEPIGAPSIRGINPSNRPSGSGGSCDARGACRSPLLSKMPVLKSCHCRRLCSEKFVSETRVEINSAFWARNFSGRRAFFDKYITIKHCLPAQKKNRIPQQKYKRKITLQYSLPSDEDTSERVCKTMFLRTLGMRNDGRVTLYVRKKMTKGTESALVAGRGRQSSKESLHSRQIKNHILGFHPQVSHYRRKHAPLRRYLESSLSVWLMWKDYLVKHGHVSYGKYWQIFRHMRITIGSPKSDMCDFCEEAKLHRADTGPHPLDTCETCAEDATHQANAALARKQYSDDRMQAWAGNQAVYAVDMQRVLLLPTMQSKRAFFTSRLVCFNETFAALANGADSCVLWEESVAGRNADDVASAYVYFIQLHCKTQTDFLFWADNCTAQNKNWVLFSALLQLVNSASGPNAVTIRYVERGHTYMRPDAIHGHISQRLQKAQSVYTFTDLVREISSATKCLHSLPMGHQNFRNWTSLKQAKATCPKLHQLREVHFHRGNSSLFYKRRLDLANYSHCSFLGQLAVLSMPEARACPRGINGDKKNEICKQLVPLMPREKRDFWLRMRTTPLHDLNTFYK